MFRQKGCVVLADAFAPDLIRQFAAKFPIYNGKIHRVDPEFAG